MAKKGPCWQGYEMIGMKSKGGRKVPNCVPKKSKGGEMEYNGSLINSEISLANSESHLFLIFLFSSINKEEPILITIILESLRYI